ncbi:MAG: hypothetical protein ABIY70_05465, partial [Capsulimonas sp.]|uniref:hypothetical protein n=1 Tax=Capsulimonas sp. TaxID=2494211 RepID=UPI00326740AC
MNIATANNTFIFDDGFIDPTDIDIYIDNIKYTGSTGWSGGTLTLPFFVSVGSTVELVRKSPINTYGSNLKALYLIQEADDLPLYMNNRNTSFLLNGDVSNTLDFPNGFPMVQFLPTGRLTADPDLVNLGGFDKAHFRFQSRLPATTPAESMSFASFQSVIENPFAYLTLGTDNAALTFTAKAQGAAGVVNVQIIIGATGSPSVGGTGNSIILTTASTGTTPLTFIPLITGDLRVSGLVTVAYGGNGGTNVAAAPLTYLHGPTEKHTYNGLLVTMKGYQGYDPNPALHEKPQSTAALNVDATTGRGQSAGKAEAVVVTAEHEDGSMASALFKITTTSPPDTLNAHLTISWLTKGVAGNSYSAKLQSGGSYSTVIASFVITITVPSGLTTAAQVANAINTDATVNTQIVATVGGVGSGLPTFSSSITIPLTGGIESANGKLVGVQSIVRPLHDPGSDNPPTWDCYAYAANGSGSYPGYAAYIAKASDEADDDVTQGWHNAFVVDGGFNPGAPSIKKRVFWYYDYFVVTAKDSTIGTQRLGTWMGVGTDLPDAPFHLKAVGTVGAATVTANVKLERVGSLSNDAEISQIGFFGIAPSALAPEEVARITATMANAVVDHETGTFILSTAFNGSAVLPRWHFSQGLWADGAAGGEKGAGSINALKIYQNNQPVALGGAESLFGLPVSPATNLTFTLTVLTSKPEQFRTQVIPTGITISVVLAVSTIPVPVPVYDGARFRVIRSDAGAGDLMVYNAATGTTPLVTFTGTTGGGTGKGWADFTYRAGTLDAWFISAYGT